MTRTVRLDDDLIAVLEADAAREARSLAGQISYYVKLGRAFARSPDFAPQRVEDAMSGGIEVHELTLEEQEAFFAEFASLMEKPGASHEYWEDRKQRGFGVGVDANGNLVRQLAGGATAPL